MLDLASGVLGSGNYAVDFAYGVYYQRAKSYKDALAYYEQAVQEAETAPFPDVATKNATIADMLQVVGIAYQEQHKNADALTYQDRTVALNGKNPFYRVDR